MKLTEQQIKTVKGMGCLRDKRFDDVFNVRVMTRNGHVSADEMRVLAEAAERFGSGKAALTTRLSVEIQGVQYENIEPLMAFLNDHGLSAGGTGAKVRPVVACKGTTCQFGLIDTYDLSMKLHERFYLGWHDVQLPHKFKMAVGGCPNNCVKPDLNDLGIIGQRVPAVDVEKCRGCAKCQVEASCPVKVAKLQGGKVVIDPAACNSCGRCKGKCPFGAVSYSDGYRVYLGGRWGKRTANGRKVEMLFTSEDEIMSFVEKVLSFYRDNGTPGERFADTLSRLGFEEVVSQLLD